jgi:hypothetical protein
MMMTPLEVELVEAQDHLISAFMRLKELGLELNRSVLEAASIAGRDGGLVSKRCSMLREKLSDAQETYKAAIERVSSSVLALGSERQEQESLLERESP